MSRRARLSTFMTSAPSCAKLRQHRPGERPRGVHGEIGDPDAVERSVHFHQIAPALARATISWGE